MKYPTWLLHPRDVWAFWRARPIEAVAYLALGAGITYILQHV